MFRRGFRGRDRARDRSGWRERKSLRQLFINYEIANAQGLFAQIYERRRFKIASAIESIIQDYDGIPANEALSSFPERSLSYSRCSSIFILDNLYTAK